jgi:hypothetical protein
MPPRRDAKNAFSSMVRRKRSQTLSASDAASTDRRRSSLCRQDAVHRPSERIRYRAHSNTFSVHVESYDDAESDRMAGRGLGMYLEYD